MFRKTKLSLMSVLTNILRGRPALIIAGVIMAMTVSSLSAIAQTTKNIGAGNMAATPDLTSWLLYNDENDTIGTFPASFVGGPASAPIGNGSIQISASGSQRRNIATYQFSGTVLSTITTLKFSTYNPSAGNGGSANNSGYLHFNVDFNLSDTWQRRLVYVPAANGSVVQDTWQEWDAINGGNALWSYSGPTWPAGIGEPGTTAGTTTKTWSQILATYPNVRMRVTDSFLGIRVGEPYPSGYTENIDAFKFGTGGGDTYFNFEPAASQVYVDDNWIGTQNGADPDGAGPATSFGYDAFATVGEGTNAVAPGGTVTVYSGSYTLSNTVNMNKAGVTITGATPKPVIQAASAIGDAFFVTAAGVTLNNLEIQKTDLANQTIIAVQADNFTATNNLIYGPSPGMTWNASGIVSRAFVISANNNITISNNTIRTLRQPAYISGSSATGGTISGNNVSGTKGWVIEGGKYAFSGNTWGEPQNQDCDIALLATLDVPSASFYQPLLALSTNNDNGFICAQYAGGENGRAVAYVDDGASPNGNGSDNANYTSINTAIAGTLAGGTVSVAGGTYPEDVTINKTVKVLGAGPVGTTVIGPIGGSGSTFSIAANNVELSGFTITRAGNNVAQWNDAGLNSAGISIQGLSILNALVHDNMITGMRTGIDVNSSNGHTFRNNVLDNNHTGLIFRNQTDNITFVENMVTNNRTVGVLFLDASSGSNVPIQTAINCTFFNNNISGNWYGGIVDRQSGGSLPAPGTNLKNFSGNWYGTNTPVVTTANSAEPGYSTLIPVAYGGSAVAPGGQPDIAGPASANFDFSPFLNVGTDTNVQTTPGRGTYGFQGSFNDLNISATSAQMGAASKIQEAIDLMTAGGTLTVPTGTYPGNVNVNKAMTIKGTFTVGGTFTTSAAGVVVSPGYSPGIINSGDLSLGSGTTLNMEINGTSVGTQYDQLNVTGTVSLGSATLNVTLGYVPAPGDSFTIVNNDGADAVTGTFAGLPNGTVFSVGANTLRINYDGGTGNDVVLTSVSLCNAVSISTGITTLTGVPVDVPVTVDNTTGNSLYSADFTVTYNPAVLTPNGTLATNFGVTLGAVGTSNGGGRILTVNNPSAGTLVISIFGANPMTGMGELVKMNFNVIGAPSTTSPMNFSSFKFNEGTPCLTTNNGLVTVLSGTITGTVTYGNPLVGPAPPRAVPNATLNAVGSINTSATTDAGGMYTLSGMGSGAYTVTPSKTGGANGALSGLDSALIAQYVVGLTSLNTAQQTVADVSDAGGITSFDAALIARYVVSLPNSGSSGTWRFIPTSRNYPNVNTNQTAQDYSALLMGDVTGNWGDPGSFRLAPTSDRKKIGVSAGSITASPNSEVSVPVTIGDVSGKGVLAYQFDISYDPEVVAPALNPVETGGTMSDGLAVTANAETPGVLKVVVFGANSLNGRGTLLNLKFTAIGPVGSVSPLSWQEFMLNEGGALQTKTTDGRIEVTSAAPGEASITGRLLTPFGQGVPNTRITLTDTTGASRTILSNGFGNYQFGNVRVGETYILSAESRQHTFTPVTVSVSGSLVNVDIIAVQ